MQKLQAVPLTALQHHLHLQGLEIHDGRLVRWRKNAAEHPRNWLARRKAYDITLVIFLDFFM